MNLYTLADDEKILPISGFEDKYLISSKGRVWSIINSRWLTPSLMAGKYYGVQFSKGGVRSMYVHRLVASHFIPNPQSKSDVNHVDHNPLNNDVLNLEWTTSDENKQASRRNRIRKKVTELLTNAMKVGVTHNEILEWCNDIVDNSRVKKTM